MVSQNPVLLTSQCKLSGFVFWQSSKQKSGFCKHFKGSIPWSTTPGVSQLLA